MTRARVIVSQGDSEFDCEVRVGLGFQALKVMHPEVPLEFDCRKADCGVCLIRVHEGLSQLSPPTSEEADFLKAMRAHPSERLACQCRIMGAVTVEIPPA